MLNTQALEFLHAKEEASAEFARLAEEHKTNRSKLMNRPAPWGRRLVRSPAIEAKRKLVEVEGALKAIKILKARCTKRARKV